METSKNYIRLPQTLPFLPARKTVTLTQHPSVSQSLSLPFMTPHSDSRHQWTSVRNVRRPISTWKTTSTLTSVRALLPPQENRQQAHSQGRKDYQYNFMDDHLNRTTLMKILHCNDNNIQLPAVVWGREEGEIAKKRECYAQEVNKTHQNVQVSLCGFVIRPDEPHLGTSPDGKGFWK